MEYFDLVIVGGGAAGLSAAYYFTQDAQSRLKILLLEANPDRLGGRIHTVRLNGSPLELGAQWIHGRGENPLWKFVQEHNVSNNYARPCGQGALLLPLSDFGQGPGRPERRGRAGWGWQNEGRHGPRAVKSERGSQGLAHADICSLTPVLEFTIF